MTDIIVEGDVIKILLHDKFQRIITISRVIKKKLI